MTDQPKPTSPPFRPVPAIPILIESHHKDECRVRTAAGVSTGATLRDAIGAATEPASPQDKEQP